MAQVRLRVRELAEAKSLNISQLQRRSQLTAGLVRRYWYNTQDGKAEGKPLQKVSLSEIGEIAKVLGVHPGELLTDEPEDSCNH